MAATRRDITTNAQDAQRFVEGVQALKEEPTGLTTADLGIAGGAVGSQPLFRYDLYPIWHFVTMGETFSGGRRNAAHSGPVFLPWHRWFLLLLEFDIRAVLGLGRDDFGLPYWNWVADGEQFTPAQQVTQPDLWGIIGGDGQDGLGHLIDDGPFSASEAFAVRVGQGAFGLQAENRPLRRRFRRSGNRLPRQSDLDRTMEPDVYDAGGLDNTVETAFRNLLEGWRPISAAVRSQMHNRVHVWVGGDMGPGTSRQTTRCSSSTTASSTSSGPTGRPTTRPPPTCPTASRRPATPLFRHRARDPLLSLLTPGSALGAVDARRVGVLRVRVARQRPVRPRRRAPLSSGCRPVRRLRRWHPPRGVGRDPRASCCSSGRPDPESTRVTAGRR